MEVEKIQVSDGSESRFKKIMNRLDNFLVGPKILYSTMSTLFYGFYTFRATFIKNHLNLRDDQYGDVSALMALVAIPALTLWGTLSDRTGRHRLILLGIVLCGVLSFAVLAIPGIGTVEALLILCLFSFFICSVQPLTDYQALRILEEKGLADRDLYGRQRSFDSFFYGLTTVSVGWLKDRYGLSILFFWIPTSGAIFLLALWAFGSKDQSKKKSLTTIVEPIKSSEERREMVDSISNPEPKSINQTSSLHTNIDVDAMEKGPRDLAWRDYPIVRLLLHSEFAFLLLVVLMIGFGRSIMALFIAKFMEEHLGMNGLQVGIASNFGIALEMTVLFFGSSFIRVFGLHWMLVLAQVVMVMRVWIYALGFPVKVEGGNCPIQTEIVVYIIELLKGLSFGLTQVAGVTLAKEIAPLQLQVTAQTLYFGTYSQVPSIVAGVIGGRVYQWYGGRRLFFVTGIIVSLAFVLFFIRYVISGKIRLKCASS